MPNTIHSYETALVFEEPRSDRPKEVKLSAMRSVVKASLTAITLLPIELRTNACVLRSVVVSSVATNNATSKEHLGSLEVEHILSCVSLCVSSIPAAAYGAEVRLSEYGFHHITGDSYAVDLTVELVTGE